MWVGESASQYLERVTRIGWPALLGEGAIMLWLLVKGARPPLTEEALGNLQPVLERRPFKA